MTDVIADSGDLPVVMHDHPLNAKDFALFYQAVHGHQPFPWQSDLVTWVLAELSWPQLVDVPTGLGKTSLLDVAVFVAAATADTAGPERVGRRRCLFVVDRRVVVDEAYEHALKISDALQDPTSSSETRSPEQVSALEAVAANLQGLRGHRQTPRGRLLPVTRMRGGTMWSSSWSDRPDDLAVVIGTVDQVGSRLLFRGYGVGDRRKPLDAAMVGNDALLLVDEAHLARALLSTTQAAQHRDSTSTGLPKLDIVQMTATAAPEKIPIGESVFAFDEQAHLRQPEPNRRLTASKNLMLHLADKKTVIKALATAAEHLAAPVRDADASAVGPVVLVVCNTIDTARAVHQLLEKNLQKSRTEDTTDLALLIGRSRPADRVGLDARIRSRFGIGAERTQHPAILVATQTVEVGVNLDVDALVSESASWDALVQRLGRLNRLGQLTDRLPGVAEATAVIVHDGQPDGPVYGAARDATWHFLTQLTGVSSNLAAGFAASGSTLHVSPLECRALNRQAPATAFMAAPEVPVLTTPILDRWVRTGPIPLDDPPIDPYLHGFSGGSPTVSLLWREGLGSPSDPTDLVDEWIEDDALSHALLAACPPLAGEQVEVPLHTARRWMLGQRATPVSDLDDAPDPEAPLKQETQPFEVLAWREPSAADGERRGPEARWTWVSGDQIRPGDQLVVPVERGGLDSYGWCPPSREPVADAHSLAAIDVGRLSLVVDQVLPARLGFDTDSSREVEAVIADIGRAFRRDEDNVDLRSTGTDEQTSSLRLLTQRLIDALTRGLTAPTPDTATLRDLGAPGWCLPQRRADLSELLSQARTSACVRDVMPVTGGAMPSRSIPVLQWRPPKSSRSASLAEELGTGGPTGAALTDRSDEDSSSSSIGTGNQVTLEQHHTNVRSRSREIATNLGLEASLIDLLADAAGWHDLGKAEHRFQVMLHGGDELEALASSTVLAKSGMDPNDRHAWRLARNRSRLPRGARHEAWSAALVLEQVNRHPYDGDQELLIHLVASHHGHARPLLPLILDTDPAPISTSLNDDTVSISSQQTVDLDHPARFDRLNQRYGRWGLALLESIIRCADMTVSAEGS
ncbi:type I-U CRISPR-associated helicase/endonuclease Cas3 [Kineosporia sp. J2-2]|uniref:Type I-U CRISPR-associated helicase/endonuclease Cas3 n=1 Tax=Kineosporia corallincola TaxID=2835133 RepID=A0ABS5TTP6_9ACTN|nr:type I-U CRISPR-associated helicase/endonuclease Cas3 [Kineosporia corallincola]MBT0774160.1 type I-U CRISPR-associated helicase/endonuclease Cas3 [Kineosporia corallincola]